MGELESVKKSDSHLHRFRIRGKEYGIARVGGVSFSSNPHEVHLADLRLRTNERFLYEYDFNDWWEHQLRLDKNLPFDSKHTYPVCVGGRRSGPPVWAAARSWVKSGDLKIQLFPAKKIFGPAW